MQLGIHHTPGKVDSGKRALLPCFFFFFIHYCTIPLHAQVGSDSDAHWQLSGYCELYYSYDFSNPANHEKADYLYNLKRHNELNVNLAMVKGTYTATRLRSNLALMVGNYAEYNLAAEPDWAKFIYEANVGVKLSANASTWLDIGILPSHIGCESAIGLHCPTLTRSVLAENSPYYETGLRLHHINRKGTLETNLLLLNGWQHIRKPDGIQYPSLGVQINYQPSNKVQLNYSNFTGSETPDSQGILRVYHDMYMILHPHHRLAITAAFDIGTEYGKSGYTTMWFSPVLVVQYRINRQTRIAIRGEHFRDKREVIIRNPDGNGFTLSGTSINVDHTFFNRLCWRVEAKTHAIQCAKTNYSLTSCLSIRF